MSASKRMFATQVIEFLGLLMDTLLMIVRVPQDKQKDILDQITKILDAAQNTAGALQSLPGKLNFIAKAFPMGRPFICRLYDLAAGKHPKRLVQLDQTAHQDVLLWSSFLQQFKGWLPILDFQKYKKASISVFMDASINPKLGWGIYVPPHRCWSHGRWDQQFFQQYQPLIDFLEMYATLIFLDIKAKDLQNYHLHFFCDNQPTVDALTNKSSSSVQLMTIIRIITLLCLQNNIHFNISHVKGKSNVHADLLSCIKIDKFMQQVEECEDLQYLKPQGQAWPLCINTLRNWPAWLTDQQLMESMTELGKCSTGF